MDRTAQLLRIGDEDWEDEEWEDEDEWEEEEEEWTHDDLAF